MSVSIPPRLDKDAFKDQTIVVTGAGRGIGRATAILLARLGGRVVLAELSDAGVQVAAEIHAEGGEALFVQTDVSLEEDVNRLVERTGQTYGDVDVLINNAIFCPAAPVMDMSVETWDKVMAVNLRGTFLTCRGFLPGMVLRKRGRIINMVSTDAMPGLSAYIASKQGITGFSQSLHAEVLTHGIQVTAFAPGMVDTPAIRGIAPVLSVLLGMEEKQFLSLSLHPAYEGLMPPEDAAAATALLAAYYMDEFNGELVDGYAILERAGWISALPQESMTTAPDVTTSGEVVDLGKGKTAASALNQQLSDILKATEEEFNQLPVFVRPMARSGFKKKTGMRLQDWVRTAQEISSLLDGSAVQATGAEGKMIDYRSKLKNLTSYYQDVPMETARFTRDKALLDAVAEKTRARLEVIRALEMELRGVD